MKSTIRGTRENVLKISLLVAIWTAQAKCSARPQWTKRRWYYSSALV